MRKFIFLIILLAAKTAFGFTQVNFQFQSSFDGSTQTVIMSCHEAEHSIRLANADRYSESCARSRPARYSARAFTLNWPFAQCWSASLSAA